MRNERVCLSVKLVRKIIFDYINIFVSMYFISLSSGTLNKFLIYRVVVSTLIIVTFYLTGRISKSSKRLWLIRSSLFFLVAYFALILYFKEDMPNYYILMGVVLGLTEGLYWSGFNILDIEGISTERRRKYNSIYTICYGILSITFPIVIGNIIYINNFTVSLVIVFILSIICALLIAMYRDTKFENVGNYDIIGTFKLMNKNTDLKRLCFYHLITGMLYSDGAFNFLCVLLIAQVLNSAELGYQSAINGVIAFIIGVLVSHVLKSAKNFQIAICSVSLFLAVSVFLLVSTNYTFAVYLFFIAMKTYSRLMSNADSLIFNNTINESEVLKYRKSEICILTDTFLYIGRVSSFVLLLVFSSNLKLGIVLFLIPIFVLLVMFTKYIKTIKFV